jgi:uncharacterized repeat protein (TIGR01451 family)
VHGVVAGGRITYTLVASNVGASPAHNASLSTTLPLHTSFVTTGGDYESLTFTSPLLPGGPIQWSLGTLAANGAEQKAVTLVVGVIPRAPHRAHVRLTSVLRADDATPVASSRVHRVNESVAPITPHQGGRLDNGDVALTFPPNAVTGTVNITFTALTTPTQNARTMRFVGRTFTLEARDEQGRDVNRFEQPYTLTFRYTDADLAAAGLDESRLNLYFFDERAGRWTAVLPCAGCVLDTANNTITVRLDHFTEFAVGETYSVYIPVVLRN